MDVVPVGGCLQLIFSSTREIRSNNLPTDLICQKKTASLVGDVKRLRVRAKIAFFIVQPFNVVLTLRHFCAKTETVHNRLVNLWLFQFYSHKLP